MRPLISGPIFKVGHAIAIGSLADCKLHHGLDTGVQFKVTVYAIWVPFHDALPTWRISFGLSSSLLRVAQPFLSAFTRVSSSFVLMILYADFVGSMEPKRGTSASYLLLSVVWRSRNTFVGEENSTLARLLSIFFRKKLAITVVDV